LLSDAPDDGLGCNGFQQLDLFVGKWSNFGSPNKYNADRDSLAQQGRGEYRVAAPTLDCADRLWKLGCNNGHQILNVD
jgi:hypothetical protein